MNKFIGSGNVTRDGELSFTPGKGTPMLKFSVAIPRGYKKEDGTDFINCVVWNKRAESLSAYIVKGIKVLVEGQLRIENKDGKTYVNLNVSDLELLGGNKGGNTQTTTSGNWESQEKFDSDITPVDDGDMPF